MLLCLDIGNSHIFGGVFDQDQLLLRFRHNSKAVLTSDQIGLFLRAVIRENNLQADDIKCIALCSVVPSLDYSVRSACLKYFLVEPFILQAGVKTGLNIKYRNPLEVGADRIANSIAAITHFPDKDLIVIDLGTATTFCAINKKKHYLGGVIMPGMKLSMTALEHNTAKLSAVEILQMKTALGRSTQESVQSGIYFGQLAALKEISHRLIEEAFEKSDEKPVIIGTGGFAQMYEGQNFFNVIVPDLSLHGLRIAHATNLGASHIVRNPLPDGDS